MQALRSAISRRLPGRLRPLGQRLARQADRLIGAPTAHLRPGAVMMLHIGRCGSTVLGNMLQQHSRIHWDDELYHKAMSLYGDAFPASDTIGWTRRQFAISGSRWYGFEFKILADQHALYTGIPPETFVARCIDIGVSHFILLHRHNMLRRIISQYIGSQTKRYHLDAGGAPALTPARIDFDAIRTGPGPTRPLLAYFDEVEAAYAGMERLLQGRKVLHIGYEEDVEANGPGIAYERICAFLGQPAEPVAVRNRKVNPYPVRMLVEDYDRLEALLAGTRHAWMLHDDKEPA